MGYIYIKSGVDSSSCVPFLVQINQQTTHRHTHKNTPATDHDSATAGVHDIDDKPKTHLGHIIIYFAIVQKLMLVHCVFVQMAREFSKPSCLQSFLLYLIHSLVEISNP